MKKAKWYKVGAALIASVVILAGCGGGSGGGDSSPEPNMYTVTATAGANGAIDPPSQSVDSGGTTSFTITADSGFSIGTVTGCNGALNGNTYTTGAITSDCTVSVTFAQGVATLYNVNVSASPANAGAVAGGGTYASGTPATVTATANTGYVFSDWTEGGSQVSVTAEYPFVVSVDRTLVANFTVDPNAVVKPSTLTPESALNIAKMVVHASDSLLVTFPVPYKPMAYTYGTSGCSISGTETTNIFTDINGDGLLNDGDSWRNQYFACTYDPYSSDPTAPASGFTMYKDGHDGYLVTSATGIVGSIIGTWSVNAEFDTYLDTASKGTDYFTGKEVDSTGTISGKPIMAAAYNGRDQSVKLTGESFYFLDENKLTGEGGSVEIKGYTFATTQNSSFTLSEDFTAVVVDKVANSSITLIAKTDTPFTGAQNTTIQSSTGGVMTLTSTQDKIVITVNSDQTATITLNGGSPQTISLIPFLSK